MTKIIPGFSFPGDLLSFFVVMRQRLHLPADLQGSVWQFWLFPAQDHVLIEQTPDFRMWIAVFRRRAIRRIATDSSARALLRREFRGETCRRLSQHEL